MEGARSKFLEVAIRAAGKAESVFKENFGHAKNVRLKAGGVPSLVSAADEEIERIISSEIRRQFPDHGIIGEEHGEENGGSKYNWYIDPIDGTTNFVHGLAHCAISVGLWDETGPLAGVVSNPILGWRYSAERGKGANKNEKQKLSVSKTMPLKSAFGTIGWRPDGKIDLIKEMTSATYRIRVLGSFAMDLALIAEGSLDFLVTGNFSLWDIAGGAIILKEAGGKLTGWDGAPLSNKTKNLIASNGLIEGELSKALAKASKG